MKTVMNIMELTTCRNLFLKLTQVKLGTQINVSNETKSAYLYLSRLVEFLYWFDRNMILATKLFSRVLETFSHFSIPFVA